MSFKLYEIFGRMNETDAYTNKLNKSATVSMVLMEEMTEKQN